MRHVGEEGAEGDDELDAEVAREADDEVAERAPAIVRLDAEQDHGIAVGARERGGVERRLGPLDPAREAVVERDGRPRRLEVDVRLGIDVGEAPRVPDTRQRPSGERRRLPSVVPAAEGR